MLLLARAFSFFSIFIFPAHLTLYSTHHAFLLSAPTSPEKDGSYDVPTLAIAATGTQNSQQPGKGHFTIKIIYATVPNMDTFTAATDPYVVVVVAGKAWRTSTREDDLTPTWNQGVYAECISATESVAIAVYDEDLVYPELIKMSGEATGIKMLKASEAGDYNWPLEGGGSNALQFKITWEPADGDCTPRPAVPLSSSSGGGGGGGGGSGSSSTTTVAPATASPEEIAKLYAFDKSKASSVRPVPGQSEFE